MKNQNHDGHRPGNGRVSFRSALVAALLTTSSAATTADATLEIPASYEGAGLGSWKTVGDTESVPDAWWVLYDDPTLSNLIERALEANQDIQAAAARLQQAWASAGVVAADTWPSAQVDAAGMRGRNLDSSFRTGELVRVPLTLGYEIDLWGRVRNGRKAANESAWAETATYSGAQLSITTNLAQVYFYLLAAEREESIVAATAATRREARDVFAARLRSGSATDLDLSRAETELATSEAELAAIRQQFAALRTSLAVLVGTMGESALPPTTQPTNVVNLPEPPAIPAGLPGELLERRPDLVAAAHAMAAANARIGVARAAFFPSITLTGSAGYEGAGVDDLFSWDHRAWSIGPRIHLPIFQGGRNRASLARANSVHDEAIALYRQRVLHAFREVQDAIDGTRFLASQSDAQRRAVGHARHAADLARKRYDSGFVSYLDVVDSERTALSAERTLVRLEADRLATSVVMIKAIGGGWATDQMAR